MPSAVELGWISEVLQQHDGAVEAYLFGSWIHSPTTAGDIDIALVYLQGQLNEAADLAATLRERCPVMNCDVIVLSQLEDKELAFVTGARAVRIWPSQGHD